MQSKPRMPHGGRETEAEYHAAAMLLDMHYGAYSHTFYDPDAPKDGGRYIDADTLQPLTPQQVDARRMAFKIEKGMR